MYFQVRHLKAFGLYPSPQIFQAGSIRLRGTSYEVLKTRLHPYSQYDYFITATNGVGEGPPCACEAQICKVPKADQDGKMRFFISVR